MMFNDIGLTLQQQKQTPDTKLTRSPAVAEIANRTFDSLRHLCYTITTYGTATDRCLE